MIQRAVGGGYAAASRAAKRLDADQIAHLQLDRRVESHRYQRTARRPEGPSLGDETHLADPDRPEKQYSECVCARRRGAIAPAEGGQVYAARRVGRVIERDDRVYRGTGQRRFKRGEL